MSMNEELEKQLKKALRKGNKNHSKMIGKKGEVKYAGKNRVQK